MIKDIDRGHVETYYGIECSSTKFGWKILHRLNFQPQYGMTCHAHDLCVVTGGQGQQVDWLPGVPGEIPIVSRRCQQDCPDFFFPREAIPLVSIGFINKISGLEEKQGFQEEDASFPFLMPPQ